MNKNRIGKIETKVKEQYPAPLPDVKTVFAKNGIMTDGTLVDDMVCRNEDGLIELIIVDVIS